MAGQRKNDELILTKLDDIKQETHEVNQKIDDLEQHLTKKAMVAGGIAGAVSGTLTSGFFSFGMEVIKAKLGG